MPLELYSATAAPASDGTERLWLGDTGAPYYLTLNRLVYYDGAYLRAQHAVRIDTGTGGGVIFGDPSGIYGSLAFTSGASSLAINADNGEITSVATGVPVLSWDASSVSIIALTVTGNTALGNSSGDVTTFNGDSNFTISKVSSKPRWTMDSLDWFQYNRTTNVFEFVINNTTIGQIDTSGFNGNASTATILQTARTIAMTGDGTWNSGSFNGSANVTAAMTLATVNSNVGTFGSATQAGTFTVNAKGLITAASNVTITPAVGSITGLGTGVATALGVNVGSAGAFVTFNGAGGTPSSLMLTNATGLPASALVASTTQAVGFGSIELGHASDTTIARASAGDIQVEGNRIFRVGGADVPVADGGTGASTAQAACQNLAAPYTLAQSGAAVSHTGDTSEFTAATISIPAGAMGANGSVLVDCLFTCTANANTELFRIKLDGTTMGTFGATSDGVFRVLQRIWNANSQSSQKAIASGAAGGFGSTGSGMATASVNTAIAKNLTITIQAGNAADTVALEAYTVTLQYGA